MYVEEEKEKAIQKELDFKFIAKPAPASTFK